MLPIPRQTVFGSGFVYDHISDHNGDRSEWKQWRQARRRGFSPEQKAPETSVSQWKSDPAAVWEQDAGGSSLPTPTTSSQALYRSRRFFFTTTKRPFFAALFCQKSGRFVECVKFSEKQRIALIFSERGRSQQRC